MNNKILLLSSVLLLCSCASNKLSNTMWYNSTLVNNNGVWGNVVSSMWFEKDSFYVFNGVAVNDTVAIQPYMYAIGRYAYKKTQKNNYQIELEGKTVDGSIYKLNGHIKKKELVMRLSAPNQTTNETYICDPSIKLKTQKHK